MDETFVAGDGYRWHYRRLPAVGEARALVVVLHGIQSHGGWYTGSASLLARAGYDVVLPDRRGCGRNDRDRGDAPSFRRLLDDVIEFAETLTPPRFGIGISWGGKLAAALPWRKPDLLTGIGLIAPGLCPIVRPSLADRLKIAAVRCVCPTKQYPIPLNEPALFTANPDRQQFIREDPLMLRRATARMLFESGRLDLRLRWVADRQTLPTFVALAKHDRIIDNARTRQFVGRFGTNDLTIHEYEGHHTLEFETDGPPFVSDLVAWLSRLTSAEAVEPSGVGSRPV